MADARRILSYSEGITVAPTNQSGFSLNGSTDKAYWVFIAEKSITCTRIGFRVTTSATPPTYKISLMGVDASGNADGTILGGGSPASTTNGSWSSATFHWFTLDNSVSLTRGTAYAIAVEYSSGTIGASNRIDVTPGLNAGKTTRFPYSIQDDAGSASRASTGCYYGYAAGTTAYGFPVQAWNTHTFNNTTGTADEYCIKFTVPTTHCSTYVLGGIEAPIAMAAGGSLDIILYRGSDLTAANCTGAVTETNAEWTQTFDQDYVASTSGGRCRIPFTTATTLNAGAVYRIGFRPTTANNVSMYSMDVNSSDDWSAFAEGNTSSISTRLDATGDFTDTTTRRLMVDLILEDITLAASSGTAGMNRRNFGSFSW